MPDRRRIWGSIPWCPKGSTFMPTVAVFLFFQRYFVEGIAGPFQTHPGTTVRMFSVIPFSSTDRSSSPTGTGASAS